jgi:hypothetical protein
MPEFIMDTSGSVHVTGGLPDGAAGGAVIQWDDLDAFTQGYLEACFFTSADPSASMTEIGAEHEFVDGSIPHDAGFEHIHPASLARAIEECATFQRDNRGALEEATDVGRSDGYDDAAAGRDFWCDRCGHGVGYWDRDLGEIGDALAAAAQAAGNRDATFGESIDCEGPFVFIE